MKTPNPIRPIQSKPDTAQAEKRAEAAYDAVLVQRFKSGDESAFTEIVRRYYPRICALAGRTLHNQGDGEEVAQDTFIRAHRSLGNFRGDCPLAAWLYLIGLNLARNRYWFYFRRRHHATISLDQSVGEDGTLSLANALGDGMADPRAGSMTNEFVALVAECMERLDASHREILMMRTMLNLSYEEIAANLRVSVGTVKSRIARARESLRELLRQRAPEFGRNSRTIDFFEFNRPPPSAGFVPA
jgi:RNA polymerase sigma-70 factor (ECF subfamily)